MAKPLVIVESPAKAKTLSRFLGGKFRVEASIGHVRDLPERASEVPKEIKDKPWGRMAVDVDGDFTPYYVIPLVQEEADQRAQGGRQGCVRSPAGDRPGPRRRVDQRAPPGGAAAQGADPPHRLPRDHRGSRPRGHRERPGRRRPPGRRPRKGAASSTGCSATPCRRCCGRRCSTGLSAGRVQSVAVRLIVEREEERRAFHKASFWDLEARIAADGREFTATLVRLGDRRIASGKDFDADDRQAEGIDRAPADRGRRRRARHRPARPAALGGDRRRGTAADAAAVAAVHDVDAAAGSQPQARVLGRPHDEGGAGPARRRPDLVSPHRLDDAEPEGAGRGGQGDHATSTAPSSTPARGSTRPRSATRRKRTRRSGRPTSTAGRSRCRGSTSTRRGSTS